jgi:hypothetical protein
VLFAESITVSLRPNCVLERAENFTRVWVVIRIFRVSPQHRRGLARRGTGPTRCYGGRGVTLGAQRRAGELWRRPPLSRPRRCPHRCCRPQPQLRKTSRRRRSRWRRRPCTHSKARHASALAATPALRPILPVCSWPRRGRATVGAHRGRSVATVHGRISSSSPWPGRRRRHRGTPQSRPPTSLVQAWGSHGRRLLGHTKLDVHARARSPDTSSLPHLYSGASTQHPCLVSAE